jgi:hypothetical protein
LKLVLPSCVADFVAYNGEGPAIPAPYTDGNGIIIVPGIDTTPFLQVVHRVM